MSKNHWTAYWKTGALTSLPMDFEGNYDGELAAYWQSVLLQDNNQTISVLDVCTGNGAIAMLLKDIALNHDLDVDMTAVDASEINPSTIINKVPDKTELIQSIDFIGNTFVENMAAEIDDRFDLIVSQYGIEYCDTEQAARNVSQLLKPGGRLVFVAHSPDTAIHEYMQKEESMYKYLDNVQVLDAFNRFAHNKLTVNGFKNKLEVALDDMRKQIEFRSMGLFKTWASTAMQLYKMSNSALKTQRAGVKAFHEKYLYARARADDMLMVTDKLLNQKDWYLTFEQYGLKLIKHDEIIYQQEHNVGHFYEFKKT